MVCAIYLFVLLPKTCSGNVELTWPEKMSPRSVGDSSPCRQPLASGGWNICACPSHPSFEDYLSVILCASYRCTQASIVQNITLLNYSAWPLLKSHFPVSFTFAYWHYLTKQGTSIRVSAFRVTQMESGYKYHDTIYISGSKMNICMYLRVFFFNSRWFHCKPRDSILVCIGKDLKIFR